MIDLPPIKVLHCKNLLNRKDHMVKQLSAYNLDYSFYENFDADDLNQDTIHLYYESKYDHFHNWRSKVLLTGNKNLQTHTPVLNLQEISLTIKFGKVFQQLSYQNFDYYIIFEDDVILCDHFDIEFQKYLQQTPDNWDAVYFGSCVGLHSRNIIKNKYVYLKENPSSRGGSAILFKHKTINDLANSWFPFNLVSDHELSAQHDIHNHKVYWWEPPLTKQGSETGIFKSTLR